MISLGADPNTKNKYSLSPLHLSATLANDKLVCTLEDCGAEITDEVHPCHPLA
jgi:hypothetical protein